MFLWLFLGVFVILALVLCAMIDVAVGITETVWHTLSVRSYIKDEASWRGGLRLAARKVKHSWRFPALTWMGKGWDEAP